MSNLAELPRRRFRTFESLSVRDYRLLWLGQCNNSMGQWMDQVTRGWLIYSLTGSPVQLGLATATRGLPLLLFGIIAGALADRTGRKVQLIVAQVTNCGLNLTLATLVLTGYVEPWHVYVTGFMAGTVQAFQQPARQTLVGDLVGNERLMNALALNSAAVNSSRAIGPSIAGALITVVGIAGSYYVQAVMYALASMWTMQIHVPDRSSDQAGRPRESFFASIVSGFSYIRETPDIRMLLLLALGPLTFGMSYMSLMPVVAKDILGGGAALQGLLLTSVGIGALSGAFFVASMHRTHGYGLPVVVGASGFSCAVFGLATSQWIPLSLGLGALIGIFNVTYQTQNQTLLQVMTPRHVRGRVMSVFLLDRGFVPLGALLAGFLASEFGGAVAMRIMSSLALGVVLLVVASRPQILRLKVPFAQETVDVPPEGPGGAVSKAVASGSTPSP
jgi:MFS family permease